jgi:hypothetical protein
VWAPDWCGLIDGERIHHKPDHKRGVKLRLDTVSHAPVFDGQITEFSYDVL